MVEIVMPRLSDTMEEGTILRWLKRDGEQVRRGEELVEIETDKATMNYLSDQEGVLKTVAREGDTLAVGELIAWVGDPSSTTPPGGEPGGARAAPDGAAVGGGVPGAEGGGSGASAAQELAATPREQGADGRTAAPAGAPAAAAEAGAAPQRPRASPLARRMARERGVDLRTLRGSGPGGRIVKADVLGAPAAQLAGDDERHAAAAGGVAPPSEATPAAEAQPPSSLPDPMRAKGETRTVELGRTQQTIARRMAESKATIPDFTLQCEVDMEECVALRSELKRISSSEAPTYNDMVVKSCALALREHPRANSSYRDGALQLYSRINIGVAVATQDALVVPTVFDADTKALGEIARETRSLAASVRDGTITPPQLGGGTFTVSNLGMYGITSFTAIINPPQAAILTVGALEARVVALDGEPAVRQRMTLNLVCDHRVLYGADAAQLLARIRELLQAPAALTL
ncbi:MAG: 2-oxo acid dehydrogenase subunit E2 [Actinobacteria bacterium]|nr:MAG: 2-oxo acid dehydrogenase subunit E2 [Actinomycetota bacterium]